MTRPMFGNDPVQNMFFVKMIPEECIFRVTQKDKDGNLIVVDEGRSIEGKLHSIKAEEKSFFNKKTQKDDTMNIVKIMLKGDDETYLLLNSSLGNLTRSLVCTLAGYTEGRIKISLFKGDDGYPVILVRNEDKQLMRRAEHANLSQIFKDTVKKVTMNGKPANDYFLLDQKIMEIANAKNEELKAKKDTNKTIEKQTNDETKADGSISSVIGDFLKAQDDPFQGSDKAPRETM